MSRDCNSTQSRSTARCGSTWTSWSTILRRPPACVGSWATRFSVQPNIEHCLAFAHPVGHPFCMTLLDEVG
jgi:hypothetical protein